MAMAVTNYYSFGGQILGEETGGVRRDYLTDALGSVTATVTGAGVVENTYRYKPYGEQLAKTGTGSDPKFLWVGRWGYRNNSTTMGLQYVRLRTYNPVFGIWSSQDPWEYSRELHKYSYSGNSPVNYMDYFGLFDNKICKGVCGAGVDDWFPIEIEELMNGLDKWKNSFDLRKPMPKDYLPWANGNMWYKHGGPFHFNAGKYDNQGKQCGSGECGSTVSLYNHCMRGSTMGNIAYGLLGAYMGIPLRQLIQLINQLKISYGSPIDQFDEASYRLGFSIMGCIGVNATSKTKKISKDELKKCFNAYITPDSLKEGRAGGGSNDFTQCSSCGKSTSSRGHGGSYPDYPYPFPPVEGWREFVYPGWREYLDYLNRFWRSYAF